MFEIDFLSIVNLNGFELVGLLFGLMLLGAVTGFLSGLLGIGGGVVLVPGLLYIFQLLDFPEKHLMHMVIGTSLSIIIPTGLTSAFSHYKKGSFQKDIFFKLGTGIIFGVLLGTLLASYLSGDILRIIFASVMMLLSIVMFVNLKKHTFLKVVPYKPLAITYGFFSGCISTLIGIGGATLNVPFMVFCKIPVHQAVGTAAALSTIISLPAMIGFIAIGLDKQGLPPFTFGYVNYLAFLTIIPTSTLLVPFGASISHKVTVKNLRRIFGIFMILVALKMWENVWDFL